MPVMLLTLGLSTPNPFCLMEAAEWEHRQGLHLSSPPSEIWEILLYLKATPGHRLFPWILKKFLTNKTDWCIAVAGGDTMDITVAEKIRLIMKRQNKTMGDIAEISGQTRQNLSNKMTRGNFTEKDIRTLAGALDCQVEIRFTLPDGTGGWGDW